MSKKILIDASHPKNTRIAVVNNGILESLDFELNNKNSLRGNVYLGIITKVENSLQAAFVDYGQEKNGFLPFSEIHPDYYQIPSAEKETLIKEMDDESAAGEGGYDVVDLNSDSENDLAVKDYTKELSQDLEDDADSELPRSRKNKTRKYRISEVIRKGQLVLVQVIKEERGNKGATLSTFISISGRFFVYMPNSRAKNGISRKINELLERKRIKDLMKKLNNSSTESLLARTAANGIPEEYLEKDCAYLKKIWQEVKTKTFSSTAPSLIYTEDDILKRAVRDYYDKDVKELVVEGKDAFDKLKAFVNESAFGGSVRLSYYDNKVPVLVRFGVEDEINKIITPHAQLPSGGYLVIQQTEALTSIDVNSGKGTSEGDIEETALKTNLEATAEIARQLRLRGISGLIVVDFIDMMKLSNRKLVEREFKNHLLMDRARIQMTRISMFGLMEVSRQRTRPSILELVSVPCSKCKGESFVRSLEYMSINILRFIDKFAIEKLKSGDIYNVIEVFVTNEMASYMLNNKRSSIVALEGKYASSLFVITTGEGDAAKFKINFAIRTTSVATELPSDLGIDVNEASVKYIQELKTKKSFICKILGVFRRK